MLIFFPPIYVRSGLVFQWLVKTYIGPLHALTSVYRRGALTAPGHFRGEPSNPRTGRHGQLTATEVRGHSHMEVRGHMSLTSCWFRSLSCSTVPVRLPPGPELSGRHPSSARVDSRSRPVLPHAGTNEAAIFLTLHAPANQREAGQRVTQ